MEDRSTFLNIEEDTVSPEVESATATIRESMNKDVIEHGDDIYRSKTQCNTKRKRSPETSNNGKQHQKKRSKAAENHSTTLTTIDSPSEKENVALSSRLSLVWQYATRTVDPNYATCNLCSNNKRISTNNGSTSTLRQHLITNHGKTDLTLVDSKKKVSSELISVMRKQQLHDLLINCIVRDSRTFNEYEKSGIKNVLKVAFPGYIPPNRHTVTRRLKRLHIQHRRKLIDDLKEADYVSITIDFWSNRRMHSFVVLTGHYFEKTGFNLKSQILDFSSFTSRHTADKISRTVKKKLKELGISDKFVGVTCDGAKNMVKAIDSLDLNARRLWCMAHRLHLIVTNAFGFWIKKKKASDGFSIEEDEEEAEYMHDDTDDDEGVSDHEETSAMDDTEVIDESESNSEEPAENIDDDGDLPDIHDDEIIDNWLEGVNESCTDVVPDQEMVNSILKKCRALVSMIKRSTILTSYFDIERKKLNKKRNLSHDVKTRWNSTFFMIDNFLELREVIERLFHVKNYLQITRENIEKLSNLELNSDDWIMLSQLRQVLEPFHHATQSISGRTYPSIGFAYYLIIRIKNFLQSHLKKENPVLKRLKLLLLKQLSFYFEGDNDQLDLLKMHSYLDPAGFSTLNEKEKRSIEQHIKTMTIECMSETVLTETTSSPVAMSTTNTFSLSNSNGTTKRSAIDYFNESIGDLSHREAAVVGDTSHRATIIDDIRNYRTFVAKFSLKHKLDETSAMTFWKQHNQHLTVLGKIVRKLLCMPATSVPSETAFSLSAYLGRKERARLTDNNLSSSVFLKDKVSP